MKWFATLVVLAGIAFAGYQWWWKPRQAATLAAAEPAIPAPDAGGGTPAPPAGGDAPAADAPPAAAKAEWEQAEALWKAAAAAGEPTGHESAPQMARLYSAVLRACYNQPALRAFETRLVEQRLQPLGTALFFGRGRYADVLFGVHKVAEGDRAPDLIAKRYGMSYQHLNRLRGRDVNDGNLRLGDSLKVINMKEVGGAQLHVDKSDYYVDVSIGEVFARRYDVSIGAPTTPTPVGRTKVTDLVFNPTWTPPGSSEPIPPGDPRNILGGVWIPVASDGINESGIGFHGYTGEDQSLRKQASNGCIRLGNEAIKELAYLIAHPLRSPTAVEIVE